MKSHLTDALQAVPPTGVVGVTLLGYGLQDWVYGLTALYTVILIMGKLPAAVRAVRGMLGKGKDVESL